MRLLWLGTYERDYTRTRVLMAGLRAEGVEVIECHRPLWELTRHKAGSFLSPTGLPAIAGQVSCARGLELALEQRRAGRGRRGRRRLPVPARRAAGRGCSRAGGGVPLVADALISLSDTLAGDRARVGAERRAGADRARHRDAALRDVVIADTDAHARFYEERFGVARDSLGVARRGGGGGRCSARAAAARGVPHDAVLRQALAAARPGDAARGRAHARHAAGEA